MFVAARRPHLARRRRSERRRFHRTPRRSPPTASRETSAQSPGLILDRLGRIPSIGDRTEWNGYRLEVVDMDGQRIDRILVTRLPAEANAESNGG